MLHHAPGGQFVVLGAGEQPGDGLESLDESGEVGEAVERLGLGQRERMNIVAGAQLHQRRRKDGAFEVQMQLRLGQAADEVANGLHALSVKGAPFPGVLSGGKPLRSVPRFVD